MANILKFHHFSEEEKQLLRRWCQEGKSLTDIAKLLHRNLGTVHRQYLRLKCRAAAPKVGRPQKITEKVAQVLVKKAEIMVKDADSKCQVTADMIRKGAGLKCCTRVVLNALHAKGIYLHPMREKPVRTEVDEADRLHFGKIYGPKPLSFWEKNVHAYIDNKYFPVYLSPKARAYAAKLRGARGTFRKRGGGLGKGHVKPRKNLKMNFGAKSVLIAAAIDSSGVLMWHEVTGNWNGKAAETMYSSILAPALQRKHKGKRRFVILEDNDPSGYKSNLGISAKRANRLDVLDLPRRSPDLNPLDYGFWAEVNRRMRKQERSFPKKKQESRSDFINRLKRTATRISAVYLQALVHSMKRRCVAVEASKGCDFEE